MNKIISYCGVKEIKGYVIDIWPPEKKRNSYIKNCCRAIELHLHFYIKLVGCLFLRNKTFRKFYALFCFAHIHVFIQKNTNIFVFKQCHDSKLDGSVLIWSKSKLRGKTSTILFLKHLRKYFIALKCYFCLMHFKWYFAFFIFLRLFIEVQCTSRNICIYLVST